jgi:catechol 2,3-dioxygenase-like lactoylglutathione lyase family enzyme
VTIRFAETFASVYAPAGRDPAAGKVTGAAMARLVGINHVALEVGDIEEALSWYGSVFEFELRGRAGSRMAFIDMGDQFIALSSGRGQAPDAARHFGLVVDDKEAVRARLRELGVAVQASGSLDFSDPWGNHVQVVDYRDVQFTKAPEILRAMSLDGLGKSEQAQRELEAKGLGSTPRDMRR